MLDHAKIPYCGNIRHDQSPIVGAISGGHQAARAVDEFLIGSSQLPR
jgi:glutamate synthase (NADPH) small chain